METYETFDSTLDNKVAKLPDNVTYKNIASKADRNQIIKRVGIKRGKTNWHNIQKDARQLISEDS